MFLASRYFHKMRRSGVTNLLAGLLCVSSVFILISVNSRPSSDKVANHELVRENSVEQIPQNRSTDLQRKAAEKARFDEETRINEPTWFLPGVLLQNGANQYITGSDFRAKAAPHNEAFGMVKPPQPQMTLETTIDSALEILAKAERCTVSYVGCFFLRIHPSFFKNQIEPPGRKTAKDCIRQCSLRRTRYAGVSAAGKCSCGENIGSPTLLTSEKYCDSKCPGDPAQICGGGGQLSVYRVVEFCLEKNITILDIARSTIGCFSKSQEMTAQFQSEFHDPNNNAATCLLHCEKTDMTIAAWDNIGTCQCGRFDHKFSLRRSGHGVNMSFCGTDACPPTSAFCSSKYLRIMRTNVDDQICGIKKFISPEVGRLVALISFPGSGNTWVRYLIESATGIYSGSIYADSDLYQKGFLGEPLIWNSKRTSVIKTHSFAPDSVAKFAEAIFVIRNPYDAIQAEFNRLKGGHVGHAHEDQFTGEEWRNFVSYKIEKWFNTCKAYSTKKRLLVVFFEDIVANAMTEIKRMVDFLKYPVEDLSKRMACLENNLGGNFKRKKRKLSFDPFPQELKEKVNNYIASARRKLVDLGLPKMPPYER